MPYFSIQWMLRKQLKVALEALLLSLEENTDPMQLPVLMGDRPDQAGLAAIPVTAVKKSTSYFYESAIALKLAPHFGCSPPVLADAIQQQLIATTTLIGDRTEYKTSSLNQTALDVDSTSSGWLRFEIRDTALGVWLEHFNGTADLSGWNISELRLISTRTELTALASQDNPSFFIYSLSEVDIFSWQRIHARCCSWLQLAHRLKIIQLASPPEGSCMPQWRMLQPVPLPWLTPENQWGLAHPSEQALLQTLISVVDGWMVFSDSRNRQASIGTIERLLCLLSHAFEGFSRQMPAIAGTPAELQRRAGLVLAVKQVLAGLLVAELGLCAPDCL